MAAREVIHFLFSAQLPSHLLFHTLAREKAEEDPNEIYFELKAREKFRREQGLAPRTVVLPWTQADDDRILAMQNAAFSSLPSQPGQLRVTGDTEQENQKGGTPT